MLMNELYVVRNLHHWRHLSVTWPLTHQMCDTRWRRDLWIKSISPLVFWIFTSPLQTVWLEFKPAASTPQKADPPSRSSSSLRELQVLLCDYVLLSWLYLNVPHPLLPHSLDFLHFPELLQTTCWEQVVFSAARTGGESSENNGDNNGIPVVESIVPGTVFLNISFYAKVYFLSNRFWREMLCSLPHYLYQTALSHPRLRLLAQGCISGC